MSAKLFMVLLGCKPEGRTIEQHDMFFGIAEQLKDLVPAIIKHWPEANGKVHIDAYREVRHVNGFEVSVHERAEFEADPTDDVAKIYFINLGGYKPDEFEEHHYKMIVASHTKADAIKMAKQTVFYKHTGFKGATSHIDDKYGIDVDDMYAITDILTKADKDKYVVNVRHTGTTEEDQINLGYFQLHKL